jgi:hypothetical protein
MGRGLLNAWCGQARPYHDPTFYEDDPILPFDGEALFFGNTYGRSTTAGDGPFDRSWLATKLTPLPTAYWPLNDPLLSMSFVDWAGTTATNFDISGVNQSTIVEQAPLPYIERCADFTNETGLNTTIVINPASDNFTLFGWVKIDEIPDNNPQAIFALVPSSGVRMRIGYVKLLLPHRTVQLFHGSSSSVQFIENIGPGKWWHFVFVYEWGVSGGRITTYINGVKTPKTKTGLNTIAAGDLILGPHEPNVGTFKNKLSRVGVIKGATLDAKRATRLFLKSSVTFEKRMVYYQ